MSKKSLPSLEELKEYLSYDPDSGLLTWIKTGKEAGCKCPRGYKRVVFKNRCYYVHRVVWVFSNSRWPELSIDHINGNKSDNRLVNLREVSHKVNCQNRREHRTGHLLGTNKRGGRYKAQIQLNGKIVHLGTFDTAEEAHQAYLKARA